jgi:hypothetical protein
VSDSIKGGAPASQMIGSRAVGPQLELINGVTSPHVTHPGPHTQERTASCPLGRATPFVTCHLPFVGVLPTRIHDLTVGLEVVMPAHNRWTWVVDGKL